MIGETSEQSDAPTAADWRGQLALVKQSTLDAHKDIGEVRNEMREGFRGVHRAVSDLSEKFSNSGKWSWPIVLACVTLFITVMGVTAANTKEMLVGRLMIDEKRIDDVTNRFDRLMTTESDGEHRRWDDAASRVFQMPDRPPPPCR